MEIGAQDRYPLILFLIYSPGMYYLRSRPAVDPIKFTLDKEELINLEGDYGKD